MSRHDDPSRQIYHKAAYQSYNNLGQQATEGGIINNNIRVNQSNVNPREELQKHCSHSAAFDSAARFNPPRCTESTRLAIIHLVEDWINSDGDTASLFWLHGGAGVGKSALAQSLSEKHQRQQLAASFFFFRSDPTRNNGAQLIPTLVSHLVRTFEGFGLFVGDRIVQNPTLFMKRCETQIQELLVEPLLALKSTEDLDDHARPIDDLPVNHPRLIVIDGLDECANTDLQCELLRVIAGAIPQIPYPLRIFVTSRPEAHITDVFDHDRELQAITVHRYNLSDDPNADMDIRKFLEKEFLEIRRVHRLQQHLPDAWPTQEAISSLVERSSGHFIYASTVIGYIRSPKHRPDDRLQVILRLRPPQEGDRPYAQLDALYDLIFQCIESHSQLEKICLVLGILYFRSQAVGLFSRWEPTYTTIEELLEMEPGDLVLLLDPILSLVAIDQNKVRILHKSLFDYLLDSTRGGHLPLNLARVHESSATFILRMIVKDVCSIHCFEDFAYHCRYAYLNDALKDYLYFLDVPCPKSAMTKVLPPWDDDVKSSLQSIMWDFFRTLSRDLDDFDFTGQVHEQYAANWMDYFHQTVPGRTKRIRGAVSNVKSWLKDKLPTQPKFLSFTAISKVNDLKRRLDRLLKEWQPPDFIPMDVKMDAVMRTQREHNVFSAYAKASFSGDTNMIVSSLVIGDRFIHSYDAGIREKGIFLDLRAYSRHGNTCFRYTPFWCQGHEVVRKMREYLSKVEKYFLSNFHQKYGLEPGTQADVRSGPVTVSWTELGDSWGNG